MPDSIYLARLTPAKWLRAVEATDADQGDQESRERIQYRGLEEANAVPSQRRTPL
jgi:hypothetical protein